MAMAVFVKVRAGDGVPEYVTLTVGDTDAVTDIVDDCDGDTVNDPDNDKLGVAQAVTAADCVTVNDPETVMLPDTENDVVTVAEVDCV